MKTLADVVDLWWEEVSLNLNGAILFLDEPAAECLHWHGGIKRVLESGAVGVRNFSTFERASPSRKKAVFVLTSPLLETVLQTLMDIIKGNSFQHCVLISSFPLDSVGSRSESDSLLSTLESQMLKQMGNMNYIAEAIYIPIFALSLLPDIFIMPSMSKYIPPVIPEFFFPDFIQRRESGLLPLQEDILKSVKMLSFFLSTLLDSLQLKGDIFSLGPFSHFVGVELGNLCHASRKKGHTNKASVLLIDRSLDMASPLSQACESPLGKMVRIMPHLNGHVCDIGIDMSDLSHCSGGSVFGLPLLAPGCIAHRNNSAENDGLVSILTSKVKESLIEINRKVVQVGVKDGMAFDASSTNVAKALKKRVLSYKDKSDLLQKNCGLLQQALGILQILDHPLSSHLDDLLATEKLILQNFSLSGAVARDIGHLIANRKGRNYKMIEVLTLISYLYSLSDGEVLDSESEATIQATIMEALFQDDVDTVDLVRKLAGDDADDEDILSAVKSFIGLLNDLRKCRKNFTKYRSIFDPGDSALPASYVPLLKRILEDIFRLSDMPDVEYHSGGLRDYIKTGFSLFMNVTKPRPMDNSVVFIIILGGITAQEVKLIHDITSRYKTPKVYVGSTSLITPEDAMDNLLDVVNTITSKEPVTDFY